MKKLKTKEFDLFGTRYTLEYPDKIESEDENTFTMGRTNSAANTIQVARLNYEGQPAEASELKITLLHELLHAILDEGQYNSSSADEPMVEWIARCLKSLLDQKII